jgi:hypothetical protein
MTTVNAPVRRTCARERPTQQNSPSRLTTEEETRKGTVILYERQASVARLLIEILCSLWSQQDPRSTNANALLKGVKATSGGDYFDY